MTDEKKRSSRFGFDARFADRAVFHDIEVATAAAGFFDEPYLQAFGTTEFQDDVARQVRENAGGSTPQELQKLKKHLLENLDETVVSEVLLEVVQSDMISSQDYLNILTRLTALAQTLVDRGRFEEVLNIYNTLYPHTLGGRFQNEASSTIDFFFRSESFLKGFLSALRVWGVQNRDASVRLARVLKSQIIAPLLDAALVEEKPRLKKLFLAILVEFRGDIIPEVVARLDHEDPGAVRTMLYLLRKAGNYRLADQVRKLVAHPDARIHTAAVRTLLHFRVKEAVPHLKLYLESPDGNLKTEGIELAATYKVREAVPILLGILEEKGASAPRREEQAAVIRALGRIGDASAVKTLVRIAKAKSIFRRGQLDDLKLDIFHNLKNYPLEAIQPLLEVGLKSKNAEICSTSKGLLTSLHASRRARENDA